MEHIVTQETVESQESIEETEVSAETPEISAQTTEEFRDATIKKVQLDVDDAPFLGSAAAEATQNAKEEFTGSTPASISKKEDVEKPKSKKKLFIIIGAALLILIIGAGAFLFLGGEPPEDAGEPFATIIIVPTPPKTDHVEQFQTKLETFWVPLKTNTNETRFLVATFILNTSNTNLQKEIESKINVIRDAIFFYLNNKEYEFLTDNSNIHQVKEELIFAINQNLVSSKLEELFFDSFLIK